MKVLLLKLEGPMASFGDVAIDELRPTARHPFKSMIVGLLANALGYRRTEPQLMEALQSSIMVASRIDRIGGTMIDYQTAWTSGGDPKTENPKKPSFLRKGGWVSRPVNERTNKNDNSTIQIYRDYLFDVSVTVAITGDDAALIERLGYAIQKPARPLFLGRKACPPSRPLFDGFRDEDSLISALRKHPLTEGAEKNGTMFPCRTEAVDLPHSPAAHRILQVRDLKNWANNFHGSARTVVECMIEVG